MYLVTATVLKYLFCDLQKLYRVSLMLLFESSTLRSFRTLVSEENRKVSED